MNVKQYNHWRAALRLKSITRGPPLFLHCRPTPIHLPSSLLPAEWPTPILHVMWIKSLVKTGHYYSGPQSDPPIVLISVTFSFKEPRWWRLWWVFKTIVHKPIGDVTVVLSTIYFTLCSATSRTRVNISLTHHSLLRPSLLQAHPLCGSSCSWRLSKLITVGLGKFKVQQ